MKNPENYTALVSQRYERKYVPENLSWQSIRNIIMTSSAFFRPIFHARYINNIYFDTADFENYYENVHGKSQRKKIRIRWYGDIEQKNIKPILEIKIKSGHLGTKRSFPLPKLNIPEQLNDKDIRNLLLSADLPEDVQELIKTQRITLLNRYEREYFRDISKDFRITIDRNIGYLGLNSRINQIHNLTKTHQYPVVELKYEEALNDKATDIAQNLPFRLTKNSKYVNGIETFFNVTF
jgi:hypothetical protein